MAQGRLKLDQGSIQGRCPINDATESGGFLLYTDDRIVAESFLGARVHLQVRNRITREWYNFLRRLHWRMKITLSSHYPISELFYHQKLVSPSDFHVYRELRSRFGKRTNRL